MHINNDFTLNPVGPDISNRINSLYGKPGATQTIETKAMKGNFAPVYMAAAAKSDSATPTTAKSKANAPMAKISTIDSDEAFARMLQEQEDADFAMALQAIKEQEANDAAIAKLLQADEDEAFARMLQEQEDADFAYALSLQLSFADELGSSASYQGLGALGQDYYNAFYAA